MQHFSGRSAAIIHLHERGYVMDFIHRNEYIICVQDRELICPDDFEIGEAYLFESEEEIDENYVIYAVNCQIVKLGGFMFV